MVTFWQAPWQAPSQAPWLTLVVAGRTVSIPTYIPDFLWTSSLATTGVAGFAQWIQPSVAPEQHLHNQAGSQPLIGVETATLVGALLIYGTVSRIRRWRVIPRLLSGLPPSRSPP
jgi:hypothetical protein